MYIYSALCTSTPHCFIVGMMIYSNPEAAGWCRLQQGSAVKILSLATIEHNDHIKIKAKAGAVLVQIDSGYHHTVTRPMLPICSTYDWERAFFSDSVLERDYEKL